MCHDSYALNADGKICYDGIQSTYWSLMYAFIGMHVWAVVAQWVRPCTLNHEIPGSNLLAAAVVPLDKALYSYCLVPQKGLKAVGTLVACL